jgi:hypothetical protein
MMRYALLDSKTVGKLDVTSNNSSCMCGHGAQNNDNTLQ